MLNAVGLRPLCPKEFYLFSRRSNFFNRCCNKSKMTSTLWAVLFEKGTPLMKE